MASEKEERPGQVQADMTAATSKGVRYEPMRAFRSCPSWSSGKKWRSRSTLPPAAPPESPAAPSTSSNSETPCLQGSRSGVGSRRGLCAAGCRRGEPTPPRFLHDAPHRHSTPFSHGPPAGTPDMQPASEPPSDICRPACSHPGDPRGRAGCARELIFTLQTCQEDSPAAVRGFARRAFVGGAGSMPTGGTMPEQDTQSHRSDPTLKQTPNTGNGRGTGGSGGQG